MLYYQGYTVSFQEVPDEVSLVVLVADCPHKCAGCHSPMLQKPIGYDLEKDLRKLIMDYDGAITCVCLMGEGKDPDALTEALWYIRDQGFKTCLYTGKVCSSGLPIDLLDYLKVGPYIESLGGLDKPTTNQRMYKIDHAVENAGSPTFYDITWKFWPKDM